MLIVGPLIVRELSRGLGIELAGTLAGWPSPTVFFICRVKLLIPLWGVKGGVLLLGALRYREGRFVGRMPECSTSSSSKQRLSMNKYQLFGQLQQTYYRAVDGYSAQPSIPTIPPFPVDNYYNNSISMLKICIVGVLLTTITCINRFNFNTCRITYCGTQQSTCVSGVGDCLEAFAKTRQCFTSCKENENFNSCWKTCKQGTSDGSYLSLSKCYEDMCYLGAARALMVLGLALLMLFVMW